MGHSGQAAQLVHAPGNLPPRDPVLPQSAHHGPQLADPRGRRFRAHARPRHRR